MKGWQLAAEATSARLTHQGRTQSIRAWSRECGISLPAMRKRIQTWRDLGAALTAPKGTRGK